MHYFTYFTVPPQKPTIIDERGKQVPLLAGPYEEGGKMELTCMVIGGKHISNLIGFESNLDIIFHFPANNNTDVSKTREE